MSALDDLLLKMYRESIGEADETAKTDDSVQADPSAMAPSYISSGSRVDPPVSQRVASPPVDVAPPSAAQTYASVDATCDDATCDDATCDQETNTEQPTCETVIASTDEPLEAVSATANEPVEVREPAAMGSAESAIKALSSSSSPSPATFKPDWEIDRFPWPAICDDIEDRVESALGRAIVSITEACELRGSNSVILTGARTGLGRTTMTLCLAREAARQGKSVAIVDLDHAEPCMLECMGIEFEQGIESLHEHGVTPEGICVTAVEEGVSLLPTAQPFSPTQCTTQATRELLRTVAQHHDLVLIDASREVADLLAELDDVPTQGMILVSDPGTEQATHAFVDWMKQKNAWTLGVIENFAA